MGDNTRLMLGNEAVARGAWEAGVGVVASYPGTPSTEITEHIAKYDGVAAQWATNEKVALEVAIGASVAGARAMACMKHVGLNVAADPLFTVAYTGVNAGLVIVVADDPGMFSSQNEQDSRYYGLSAHVPVLEPSSSQECLEFTKLAFDLSEQYDTPVLLRLTTRIAHSRSLTAEGQRTHIELRPYEKNMPKYVMMPANAVRRHVEVEKREIALAQDSSALSINICEMAGDVGVITSGAAYQYVKEAMPEASVLKLGMVYPLPEAVIRDFASRVDTLYIVEELQPFIENQVKAWGIDCSGKDKTGLQGELSAQRVAQAFMGAAPGPDGVSGLPVRPPVLCPGCPHRAVFYTLSKKKLRVVADIGCYTLGALAPLSAADTVICMGASIGMGTGMDKARGREFSAGTVSVIGDSTFLHSGVTGLIDMVYNQSHGTVMILDNSTTGMTGHQDHAATGKDISGGPAPMLSLDKLCRGCGVNDVVTVDPHDLGALNAAIDAALASPEPSVIICRRPCALLSRKRQAPVTVADCKACGLCMGIGCPAIRRDPGDKRVTIDGDICVGCGLCVGLCPFNRIKEGDSDA